MLVGIDVARERGRERLGGGFLVPRAGRRLRASCGDFFGQFAHFRILGRFQAADLPLQRADAGDLADAGRDAEEQRVAGDVEGARGDVALVGVGLHVVGTREFFGQMLQDALVNLVIGVEQLLRGCRVSGAPASSGGVTKPEREKS